MPFYPDVPGRRSIRLQGYDYSHVGVYFVTIATQDRLCLFGDVADGQVLLNDMGRLAADAWQRLETRYPYVILDEYVVMPNHLHGIVVITGDKGEDGRPNAIDGGRSARRGPLGRLIGAFKMVAAKQINLARDTVGHPLWQRNYYERIVRGEAELARIRAYIRSNPSDWEMDSENPAATVAPTRRPLP